MTVSVRTAKRGVVRFRVYDKGRECGSDLPGLRIRLESQNRPNKRARLSPELLASSNLAATFAATMKPYLAADEIVAAGPSGAVVELLAKVHRGEMTMARAERLAGAVVFLRHAGRGGYHVPALSAKENNRNSARRLKEFRDAGIALEHELAAGATIPTSELLRTAIEEFTA